MLIIGIVGKKESGKTTLSDMLKQFFGQNVKEIAFGDALKEMLILADMVTPNEVFIKKTKLSRWLMQKVGTNIFRDQVDPNYWVKQMQIKLNKIKDENPNTIVIIHDMRFLNEANLVTNNKGILIRITRPDSKWKRWFSWFFKKDDHRSETEQDDIPVFCTIPNDSSLDDLWKEVESIAGPLLQKYCADVVKKTGARYINQRLYMPYEKG